MTDEALLCAGNSRDWYESVLRSHGLAWTVADGVWACVGTPPPYYSSLRTLSPGGAEDQTRIVEGACRALSRPFTVADCFARLDLAPLGLRVLFRAEWTWLDPGTRVPSPGNQGTVWSRVTSPAALEAWEMAWRAHGSPASTRVFPPPLLADGAVALLAARRRGRIVGGCAANRSGSVVGFSNFFAGDRDPGLLAASAVAEVRRFAPGLPVAGYEQGEDLHRARKLGFRSAGPLRVWIAEGPPSP